MTYTHVQRVRILYKTILRLHRGLPAEIQVLGNNYVKDEFKRHKSCSGHEIQIFMNEWTNYALTLANQLGLRGPKTGAKTIGADLPETAIENFRDEQIYQLYELRIAAKTSPENTTQSDN